MQKRSCKKTTILRKKSKNFFKNGNNNNNNNNNNKIRKNVEMLIKIWKKIKFLKEMDKKSCKLISNEKKDFLEIISKARKPSKKKSK